MQTFGFKQPFEFTENGSVRPVDPLFPYQDVWFHFDGTRAASYEYSTAPKVQRMLDVSSNGNSFLRVDPLYEGERSGNALWINDDTNNERYERYIPFELSEPFNKSFSVYTVFKIEDTGVGTACEILQTRSGGANVQTLLRQAGGGFKVGTTAMSGAGTNQTTNTVAYNAITVICSRHDNSASGAGSTCINGVEGVSWVGNMNTASGVWSNAAKASARIHQGNNTGKNFYLYEMIIFTRRTSDAEHIDILDYLNEKWSIWQSVTSGGNTVTYNTDTVVTV
jgi:hypothetical protein